MSTSDQDDGSDVAARLSKGLPGEVAGGLPDMATLTRMANDFFRNTATASLGMPNSASAASLPPGTGLAQSSSPQLGLPLPSVPAVPSTEMLPMGMDAELASSMPGVVPPLVGPQAPGIPGLATLRADPRSSASLPQSPFSLPLPGFAAAPPFATGPSESGVPSLPPLPALRTEDDVRSLLSQGSSLYFLEDAGRLNGLGMSSTAAPGLNAYAEAPARAEQTAGQAERVPAGSSVPFSAGGLVPSSPFSLPLPEFEPAWFSSLAADVPVADVPSFPSLPPLRNETEAAAALTEAPSLYFVENAGYPAGRKQAQRSGVEDLNLPRRQFDILSVRRDFPILQERVHGRSLVWLDNAATTQKPRSVIDRLSYFYEHENSNIHRAAHELAARATDAYEDARTRVAHFLKASSSKEIVFVRGATEAINLVAQAWGRRHIQKGDEIVISWIEHHANIVPWQMLCAEKGACLRVAPVDNDGQILLDEYEKLLGPKTRLVSFTQVSNALGTVTPAHQMVQMAHRYGARVLVDGAQAVSHMPIDVQSLDCDFYVFSGHKVFAPTGIGVLYGKPDALADTPPWQGGGNMIVDVTFEKTTYQPPPARFEAGTGNIADAVGLGAAIDYLDHIGMPNVAAYEHELMVYATKGMLQVPGLRIIGTAKEKAGVLSFVLEGFRTEEVGAALNREGIAVRSGHHCAQPSLRRFGVETTVRPSLALYNSFEDIDALIAALFRLKRMGA